MSSLTIDAEFRDLLPELTSEEYEELTKSIVSEGIREPIRVWNGVIVDGHNRYTIANSFTPALPFKVVEVEFASRDEVLVWIVTNQIARRNLKDVDRLELSYRITEPLKRIAAAKQAEGKARGLAVMNANLEDKFVPKVAPTDTPVRESMVPAEGVKEADPVKVVGDVKKELPKIRIRAERAKIAGVSEGKVEQFDTIRANDPDAIERIREGKSTIYGEFKKISDAAKKQEELNRLAVRAETLKVEDLGVKVEKGLFTRSEVTGASLVMCRYDKDAKVIQRKIAQMLLTNGSLILITNHTDIMRANDIPLSSLLYRGDAVLNMDGKISHALIFSKSPQNVPQYLAGTRDNVMMELMAVFAPMEGDLVVFPTKGLEEISLVAADMKRRVTVFDGDMPQEFSIAYQSASEKVLP